MTCRFFRAVIKGTDETKLNNIKDWIVSKVVDNDLNTKLKARGGAASIGVSEDLEETGNFTLTADLYIDSSIPVAKYKDIIVNQFQSLNKTGLTHAFIDQYDNCSHDEDNPQPCSPDRRMEWSA
jgi:hypothetical protein